MRTSDVARETNVHPNTVRLYEEWGFLPPIPRGANGYRRFSQMHVEQMRLARLALHGQWPGPTIRKSALALVRTAASGDLAAAMDQAHHHVALVRAEQAQAEAAAEHLQRWSQGERIVSSSASQLISQAARSLDVTPDMMRNWERNGLVRVPRDPKNGYRRYGAPEMARLRVIRMLNRAGYSQMAILRMLLYWKDHPDSDLRQALDTPRPDEDVYIAADRWLSSLAEQERRARHIVAQIEAMIALSNA